MPRQPTTLSFRTLLAAVLLLLLGGTMAVLVSLSTFTASRNFRMLTETIARQTLARVEATVQQLVQKAVDQNRQAAQLLGDRTISPTNFPAFSAFLANSLEAQPRLARLTLTLEPNGDFLQAERLSDDRIRLREGFQTGNNSSTLVYWEWRQKQRVLSHRTNTPLVDLREEPGVREAVRQRAAVWTPPYSWTEPGFPRRWAIRSSMPVLDSKGKLQAVFSTSLTLDELNRFLRILDVQVPGYVTIVEASASNGVFSVIGHPEPEMVGRTFTRAGPTDAHLRGDPILAAYVKAMGGQKLTNDFGREFRVDGTAYLGSFQRLSGADDPPWVVVMMMPVSLVAGGVEKNLRLAGISAAAFFLIAMVAALWVARRIAQPMLDLSADARAMSHLDFSAAQRPLSSIREVRQLEQSLGEAKASLRSFRKYVPADVVNTLLASGNEAKLGGHSARLTLLFSDIVDFTRVAESANPQVLVEQLGEYLAAVSSVIHEQQGVVDKYIGDGVMAFWGAPQANREHAAAAGIAAWRIQQRLNVLNAAWQAAGRPVFRTRIGINTGEVIVGNIGSEERMNYTAIGDPVNIAARLESLNRLYSTCILISDVTRLAAGDVLLTRPVARVAVKGSQRGIVVYEVLGLTAEADARSQRLIELTEAAFAALETGSVDRTRVLYEAVLTEFPGDGVATAQLHFLSEIASQISSGHTDFIRHLKSK